MAALERDLSLPKVVAIACGAMLSGIFVLPGYAHNLTGPAVYLAFLVAGVLFIPAAISKAEMATALPESGGDFVFIDRAFGPLMSTITGLGTWFTLILKSAFSLVGISSYLIVLFPIDQSYALLISIGIGTGLVFVNCFESKHVGQVQSYLVLTSFLVLGLFVERGSQITDPLYYSELFTHGPVGFFSAVSFLFVSYAGVTKIVSAAEEIKNPGRNIPLGIVISLAVMTTLYLLVSFVYVGVIAPDVHGKYAPGIYKNAPLAQAASKILGVWGEQLLSIIAVIALASMANAGILASSRYPFAMARYDELPARFSKVNPSLSTPLISVLTTGAILIGSIIVLPVLQLAKLASVFLLIIFGILNASVILFRESDIEWYNPEFKSPFYPYLQYTGILISLSLIPFLGYMGMLSAVGLVSLGSGWYFLYVRDRVTRHSLLHFGDSTEFSYSQKTDSEDRLLDCDYPDPIVVIPFFNLNYEDILDAQNRIENVITLFKKKHRIKILNIHEIADISFQHSESDFNRSDTALERYVTRLKRHGGHHVEFDRIISSYSHEFLKQFVREKPVKWTILEWKNESERTDILGNSTWWVDDFPGNLLLIRSGTLVSTETVRTIVDPFPDAEQSFLIKTAYELSKPAQSHMNVDLFAENTNGDTLTKHKSVLGNMFQTITRTNVISDNNISPTNLSSFLETLTPSDALIVDRTVAEAINSVSTDQSDKTILHPIRSKSERKNVNQSTRSIANSLSINHIHLGSWKPLSKRALFHELARDMENNEMTDQQLERGFWDTEKIYETYLENNVCAPHALVDNGSITLSLLTLKEPIKYTSSGSTVSLCFGIAGGVDHSQKIFELVQAVGEVCRDTEIVETLKHAEKSEDVLRTLRGQSSRTSII